MERVEAAQEAVPQARERLAAAERTRAERIPAIKAEGRDATARLRTLQERRAALAAAAPPAVLQRYERLLATTRPAVVTIHAGSCGGCGVAVPTAQQQQVVSGELVQCLNCRRLLVEG
jgi:predicted  nucleic acid-binding Zn-ribbon protein